MKNISISSYTIIGTNAVVTKNIEKENVVVAGVPAHIISDKGTKERTKPI